MLRAVQMGLTFEALDSLEYGVIIDMMTEAANDDCTYTTVAGQADFDRF